MIPLFVALVATVQPVLPKPVTLGRTAWIFSTIGQSEFCPPGNVTVDLTTGRYTLTARAARRMCDQQGLERPVRRGKLVGASLARLRAAYLRVVREGFDNAVCSEGRKPQDIIISNAGTPIVVLATGGGIGSAPDDLSCWSEAATALHDELDKTFGANDWH
jgi:hypothetical protein